ncbi:MAG: hypothetical protein WAM92_05195 [Mycobacterium sp.]
MNPVHHPDQVEGRRVAGRALLWALVDCAAVFGALGWVYGAATAVVSPDRLSVWVMSWVPIRIDTLAVVGFCVSAVAYVVREIATSAGKCARWWNSSRHAAVTTFLRTTFIYSTLVAIYLMANTIAHPETMAMPLTHYLAWPTEGFTLGLALICSVASFFLLRVRAYSSKSTGGCGC